MKQDTAKILHFLLAFLSCTATLINPVYADELSELYLNSTNEDSSSAIGANILIVLDTSGSMTKHGEDMLGFTVDPETYWGEAYVAARTYPGPCDPDTVYWSSFSADNDGDGDSDLDDVTDDDFEECDGDNFPLSANACRAVRDNHVAIDRFGEFRPRTAGPNGDYKFNGKDLNGEWESLSDDFNGVDTIDSQKVWRECASDAGVHGGGGYPASYPWPRDSGTTNGWTSAQGQAKNFDDITRRLVATGNYINYFRWSQTRLAAVQTALKEVIAELPPETRLGVMRFDVKVESINEGDSDGAYMIKEFVALGENTQENGNTIISANRQALIDRVYEIDPADDGGTPLGESLFEALQVFRGGSVIFGDGAETWNIDPSVWPWDNNTTNHVNVSSVAESRSSGNSNQYQSPIVFECQKNAVIFLSDGDPSGDTSTDDHFQYLPNAADNYGAATCDDSDGDPNTIDTRSCIREVADYMANEDLLPLMEGEQTVTTYTVGFGTDITAGGSALLTEAAERGGGRFTQVTNYEDLKNAFQVIFREEIASNQTQSSPAVTVNAFNRLSHEDSLYFTMFDPIYDSVRWPGNVKKYRLAEQPDGHYRIVDARNNPALNDDSSTVRIDALSYWTDENNDLAIIANGGQDGNKTKLGGAAGASSIHYAYSWFGDPNNKDLTSTTNAFTLGNLSNETVGLDVDSDLLDEIHSYMIGYDVRDEDNDEDTIEPRRAMGASPHGIPAVVNYGSEEATASQVIYAPTNDGFLHAIDAEEGHELWSFIPTEVMHNFADIYQTPEEPRLAYGLDSSIIHHVEGAGNTEKKWLFFGMRRGGQSIYALDVTDKTSPKLMWRIQGGTEGFENLAQTWSEPRIATIKVGGEATTVLVFGGGYDAATQDSNDATLGYIDDTIGNALYIVDAEDGSLLWQAGPGGDLPLTDMKSSIAAPVEIKDKNGDGLDDLIYAADLGGRIFRFDIDNASGSITGGMIASLSTSGLAGNRKFFNEPDVVLVAKDGLGYWAINIGSGDRERPKSNMTTQNYLFSIKDPYVFDTPTSYNYGITTDDLYDATDNAIQNPDQAAAERAELLQKEGWMIALGYEGEKALAQATTFDYRVFFTTFDPTPLNATDCNSQPGTARLYSLNLIDAGVPDSDNDGVVPPGDRETELPHGTIPPPVTIMFIEDEETGVVETVSFVGRSDYHPDTGKGGAVRRTFWNIQRDDDGVEQ
ncbi:MAG TPA: PilC/PilY family type IV pilus protein [Gammaproteobacteria bacterium]